jgi:hypothetical protein
MVSKGKSLPARKSSHPPADELRCDALKANGERCQNAKLKDGDKCPFHTKGFSTAARSEGAAVVNARRAARRAQIKACVAAIPLKTKETLLDFINALLVEEDEGVLHSEDLPRYLKIQLDAIGEAAPTAVTSIVTNYTIPARPGTNG